MKGVQFKTDSTPFLFHAEILYTVGRKKAGTDSRTPKHGRAYG